MDPSPDDVRADEKVPFGQRLFDNMYLLLFIGVAIMLIVFTGWGVWEVVTMPQGTLP